MKIRGWFAVLVCSVIALSLVGCNSSATPSSETVKLQGAGASFPAPLYMKWFKQYSGDHKNVEVDYQSVGSGSGVKSVIDHTVDFGASDAAMKPEEMARVQGGVQLFPMTAGSIVIAYNLKGVNLKLSRKAYSGIFLGKVKRWNAPEIAASNPGVNLPDLPINVVVRADGSGTTFVFSKHLSAISDEFDKSVGANTMPNWPVGTKSKGNEGVTAAIMTTPGSIGYIEYGYAIEREDADGDTGEQGRQVRRTHNRFGSGGAGIGGTAGQSDCMGLGPAIRGSLSRSSPTPG